jgi:hypothetical protein
MNHCNQTKANVLSVLFAPVSLSIVEDALKKEFPESKVTIYTSGYNGAKTIHLRSEDADFEGYPESTEGSGGDWDYLLNGSIGGGPDAAVAKAQRLFAQLLDSGMTVQFEVYDSTGTALFEQKST